MKIIIKILKEDGPSGLFNSFKRFLYRTVYVHRLAHSIDIISSKLGKRYVEKKIFENKMILDLLDSGLSRDLFHNGIREPESSYIYREFVAGCNGVMDIGANIGYFVLLASNKINGKIYGFEPDPRSFELLKKNISLNNLEDKVDLYNIAIGDNVGESLFHQEKSMNLSRIAKKEEDGLKINMTTIDDFVSDKEISCLRFDVEGYEFFLLNGGKKLLQKKDLKIFMEVHPALIEEYGGNMLDFFELIKDFKIKYYVTISRDGYLKNPPLIPLFKAFFLGKDVIPWEVLTIEKTVAEALEDKNLSEKMIKGGVYGIYHLFLEK